VRYVFTVLGRTAGVLTALIRYEFDGRSPSRRWVATQCPSSTRSAATSVVVYVNPAPARNRKSRISSVPR
jgi:hypothetical protein